MILEMGEPLFKRGYFVVWEQTDRLLRRKDEN